MSKDEMKNKVSHILLIILIGIVLYLGLDIITKYRYDSSINAFVTRDTSYPKLYMEYIKDQNGICYAYSTKSASFSNIPYTYIPCSLVPSEVKYNGQREVS